ncbi:uncharacterized protein LOC129952826 [Eupeodes corollae]|uniref:uncharacterized protein LOC129952826 n=1 Tax=Eupeodes corollae TaxID=290404 RepID=UPI002491118E|nr:uncharacterized protein LOC129952826 [Eupeodes corollae]
MNYRSSSDYEQYASWVQEKPISKDPAITKSKMISNTSNSSDLHSTPTALIVSPTGERTTCALDSLTQTSNPFLDSSTKELKAVGYENCIQQFPSKYEKIHQQNRRKAQFKHRKPSKIILNQRLSSARKQPKCVAVQTDASFNLPESIGDGQGLRPSFMDLTSSSAIETFDSYNQSSKQYISENQRKCLSFILMVILIFWLTSVILGVEIPAEFCRIVLNYFGSLQSALFYQEKELSFFEKLWRFIIE